ncbi:hypothetical protein EDD90_8211 [Streptomyces sp. Ag109_O5-1]|nr:hypothetical protein EDD90_8211 [Streptomyces sp. Ag109_O5-1]
MFRPGRAVSHGPALLVARPRAHVARPRAHGARTAQLGAVDDLRGTAPHRASLGNDRPVTGPLERPHTEKALAPPR